MSKITIVTGNTKKYHEMEIALARFDIQTERVAIDLPELQVLEADQVVSAKASAAFERVQTPVLVDDSGIYFPQYDLFPGTLSKYIFKCIGYEGLFRLIQPGQPAFFRCSVAYMDERLTTPQVFSADYEGTMTAPAPDLEGGEMPYAPIFIPNGETTVMSEMTPEQRIHDHRNTALARFAEWYLKQHLV